MSNLPPTSASTRFEPALGCQHCFAHNECGGQYAPGRFDCFCTTCKPDDCTYVCPRNQKFITIWRDNGGITINTPTLRQHQHDLPTYIPLIQHGNRRTTPLHIPYAALTTFDVTRRDKRTKDMIRDPQALRQKFHLQPNTALLLSSIAPDNLLESYWRHRNHRQLVQGLKAIAPTHVIAPNFSLFHDVPRFDNLANIKRSLQCAEELSNAGISVIPYIAGTTEHDWERWTSFFKEQPAIRMICKEFQTGTARKSIGEWHIHRITELQQRLGRALHIVAPGGRRYRRQLSTFEGVTILDSVPFMRTMHRRQLLASGWQDAPTPTNAPLDDLLAHNIAAYAARITTRHTTMSRRAPRPAPFSNMDQLPLWTEHAPDVRIGA